MTKKQQLYIRRITRSRKNDNDRLKLYLDGKYLKDFGFKHQDLVSIRSPTKGTIIIKKVKI